MEAKDLANIVLFGDVSLAKGLPKILNPSQHLVALSIAQLSARALRVCAAHSRRYSILVFRGVLSGYLRNYGLYVTGMSGIVARADVPSKKKRLSLSPIYEITKYSAITGARYPRREKLEPCSNCISFFFYSCTINPCGDGWHLKIIRRH